MEDKDAFFVVGDVITDTDIVCAVLKVATGKNWKCDMDPLSEEKQCVESEGFGNYNLVLFYTGKKPKLKGAPVKKSSIGACPII